VPSVTGPKGEITIETDDNRKIPRRAEAKFASA